MPINFSLSFVRLRLAPADYTPGVRVVVPEQWKFGIRPIRMVAERPYGALAVLEDELDISNAAAAREALCGIVDELKPHCALVLDARSVFIDIQGLRSIEEATQRAKLNGKRVVVASAPLVLVRVCEALEWEDVPEMFADVRMAERALLGEARGRLDGQETEQT